jgi:hypothetical protein
MAGAQVSGHFIQQLFFEIVTPQTPAATQRLPFFVILLSGAMLFDVLFE